MRESHIHNLNIRFVLFGDGGDLAQHLIVSAQQPGPSMSGSSSVSITFLARKQYRTSLSCGFVNPSFDPGWNGCQIDCIVISLDKAPRCGAPGNSRALHGAGCAHCITHVYLWYHLSRILCHKEYRQNNVAAP